MTSNDLKQNIHKSNDIKGAIIAMLWTKENLSLQFYIIRLNWRAAKIR